jgi:aminopeptidase N
VEGRRAVAAAEITRDETAVRGCLLRVESYDIELDLTRGSEVFGSVSVISFTATEPGASSYVDLIADTIHEVTLNGTPVDPSPGRITLTGLADRNVLRVRCDCAYSSEGTGLHRSVDSVDGKVYLFTHLEPASARRVFACFEQPDLKAAFTFRVIAPAHWTVLSNSALSNSALSDSALSNSALSDSALSDSGTPEPAGPGVAIWNFAPTPPISTYITAVVAGDYHLIRDSHTTATGQVIPLGLACRDSLASYLDPQEIFTITRQGIDFYVDLFGASYPFTKYDQVFVPDFGGAMENVGCVTISEQFLFRSKATDHMHEVRALIMLHEMAHMWFGDLVTMKWWDDLWLKESFAEYCATLATAEATRFTEAWTTFANDRKTWGYHEDQLPSTHPVAANVLTLTEAVANFDGISYAKGASVLKQLAAYLGREHFVAGIRAYITEHAWSNATLTDLLQALAASSGKSLADWSKAWLETAGPNTLRSDFVVGPDGTFTSFAVRQEASPLHPTLRPHHIAIGLYDRVGAALTRAGGVEVDVHGVRTEVPALTGVAQPDLILLNDGDLSYALVRFDPRSLATLTESIGGFADSLPRAICWSTAIDMVQQAEMSLPAFTRLLVNGMGAEPSASVLQVLHRLTGRIFGAMADPAWVRDGRQQLAAVASTLLRSAEPGSDHQLAWALFFARNSTTADQLDLAAALLGGDTEIGGLAVDTELRWTLLARLAATGRAGDADVDAELERDPTDDGRRQAAACRAAIPDAEHKAMAWALLTGAEELDARRATAIAHGFVQPEHAELLAPYAERYLEILPELWATRNELVRMTLGYLLFPYPAASPELLRRLNAFLAGPGHDPGLLRVVIEGRDIIERALRSRALG